MSLDNFFLTDSRDLVDCASGRTKADLVIRGGRWVCVQTGEIIPDTDIAVLGQRIAYVGPDADHTIGSDTEIIEAKGRFLVPGLIDGHMHVESGMLSVTEFVRTVLPHGTTGMFVDPHEIGNVLGIEGVRMMAKEAVLQPIHVFVQVPSCVPSAPGMETPGAEIGPKEVQEALTWPGVYGLGEVMNYPGVINNDPGLVEKIRLTRELRQPIGGHYPSPVVDKNFHAYAAGGPGDDHECTRKEDAIARVRQGMYVMMRFGSGWRDVAKLVKAVTEDGLDSRHFILCNDDTHSHTLYSEGHMDRVVRHAIAQGLKPLTAIQMATINTAEYLGLSREIGMIAPGRFADILLVDDLVSLKSDMVFAKGKLAASDVQLKIELPEFDYPEFARSSIHLKEKLGKRSFAFSYPKDGEVKASVIGVQENSALTQHLKMPVEVKNGDVQTDVTKDILKVAVIDRHHASGRVSLGLVHGFGLDADCAIASTVAHDCHQMILIGSCEENMAIAANHLASIGGGQVVIKNKEVIGQVELPIGGIISSENAHSVAHKAESVLKGFKVCGCPIENPNMQLSLMALPVIPQLRLTDLGLVDVDRFEIISVLE